MKNKASYRSVTFIQSFILIFGIGCSYKNDVVVRQPFDSSYKLNIELENTIHLKSDDPSWALTGIHSLAVDDTGRMAFVDRRKKEVWLANSTGTVIGMLGSYGNGPGEYRRPVSVTLGEAGAFQVLDKGKKILVYDFEGRFVRSYQFKTDLYTDITKEIHLPDGKKVHKVRDGAHLVYLSDSTNTVLHKFISLKNVSNRFRSEDFGLAMKGDSLLVSTIWDNRIRIFDINTGNLLGKMLVDERELEKDLIEEAGSLSKDEFKKRIWMTASVLSLDYMENPGLIFVTIFDPRDPKQGSPSPGEKFSHFKIYDSEFRFIQRFDESPWVFMRHKTVYVAVQPEMQDDGHLPNPVIQKYKFSLVDKST